MIHLEINPEEQGVLAEVLQNYLPDLRMEIADTENKDFREKLKRQEAIIKRILGELQGARAGIE